MRSIAVINQKGGVGKTTTTVNLGHALAHKGHRVLLIDMDPQGHLSPALGVFRPPRHGMDRVLLNNESISDHIVSTRELIELVPAGLQLGDVEAMKGGVERGHLLREVLKGDLPPVDYVIIDSPPSSGLLVVNTVLAVDDIMVPVAGDYLSLTGLARLMLTLRKLENMREHPVREWIFMSRFMPRRRLAVEVQEKILEHFPDNLLATTINEAASIAESAGAGRSIFEYKAGSRAAEEFIELCNDVLQQRTLKNERRK